MCDLDNCNNSLSESLHSGNFSHLRQLGRRSFFHNSTPWETPRNGRHHHCARQNLSLVLSCHCWKFGILGQYDTPRSCFCLFWAQQVCSMPTTNSTSFGDGLTQTGRVILKLDTLILATFLCSMVVLSLGNPAGKIRWLFQIPKLKYMAVSLCDQEVVYIRTILRDFGVQQNQPTLVYEDNLACIAISINPVLRKHSRHIDIRHHYIRELCLGNLVKLVSLRTNLMVTDSLTKNLPAPGLERHRSVMMDHSDFQVQLLHVVRVGWIFLVCSKVRFFYRLFRMGKSDYLNDNALRKMDIFLSLLFSEERMFFYTYKRVVFSRKSHLWWKCPLRVIFSLGKLLFHHEKQQLHFSSPDGLEETLIYFASSQGVFQNGSTLNSWIQKKSCKHTVYSTFVDLPQRKFHKGLFHSTVEGSVMNITTQESR